MEKCLSQKLSLIFAILTWTLLLLSVQTVHAESSVVLQKSQTGTKSSSTGKDRSETETKHRSPNSIYAELAGPGGIYSLNYERLFLDDIGVRLGFSYIRISASGVGSTSLLGFPLTASYLGLSTGSHIFELGGGVTFFSARGNVDDFVSGEGLSVPGNLIVGYRLHHMDGGFQFRIGFSALFGPGVGINTTDPDKWGFLPYGYLSLGGTF